ncbi:PPM-type phosphatase domain containing protein [Trema orientale]|uniref:Protein phosphatase n=1 Tax=Trema orientale TaxID=63057 RepID=A0A2P5FL21_TREOI|nr:PPM-type phosphatase domain containing protein [Trema orientale]
MKKQRLSKDPHLKMVCGHCYIPKDDESKPEGDDAHFISTDQQTIGVADGVGGWAKHGIDAGEYARELMLNALFTVHNKVSSGRAVNPKRVLQEAFLANTDLQGSSTACILAHSDGILHAANVGDSGFMLFRNNKFIYRSPIQQRRFNCPYQLGNSEESDGPDCARELKIAVVAGDVIVLGTDGLLDNMFGREIEEVLKGESKTKGGIQPKELAVLIAQLSLYNSFDKYTNSPFSEAAKKAGKYHKGGKIDDITVIVGQIVDVS